MSLTHPQIVSLKSDFLGKNDHSQLVSYSLVCNLQTTKIDKSTQTACSDFASSSLFEMNHFPKRAACLREFLRNHKDGKGCLNDRRF